MLWSGSSILKGCQYMPSVAQESVQVHLSTIISVISTLNLNPRLADPKASKWY